MEELVQGHSDILSGERCLVSFSRALSCLSLQDLVSWFVADVIALACWVVAAGGFGLRARALHARHYPCCVASSFLCVVHSLLGPGRFERRAFVLLC